jgi:hypothetical protein
MQRDREYLRQQGEVERAVMQAQMQAAQSATVAPPPAPEMPMDQMPAEMPMDQMPPEGMM